MIFFNKARLSLTTSCASRISTLLLTTYKLYYETLITYMFRSSDVIQQKIDSIRLHRPRFFTIVVAILVGIVVGMMAVLLKNLVHITGRELYKNASASHPQFLYLALPGIGIMLTVLFLVYFVKDDISHGISKVMQAISKKNGKIKFHNTYSSVITSTLTVGFGGSVGLEAPVVLTGSAIGSNVASAIKSDNKTTKLLLACGAAAAIGGIFKAPIAATVFALEVLMIDLSMWSIIPLLLASTSGTMVSFFLMGDGVMFNFTQHDMFQKQNLGYYIVLGVACGLLSVAFTRQLTYFEGIFSSIANRWKKVLVGAVLLGGLIFFMPPLFGEGYLSLQFLQGDTPRGITQLIQFEFFKQDHTMVLLFLFLVLMFKGLAVAATTASGGIGGVFAPALFMGGVAGYIVGEMLNRLSFVSVSVKNFSLAGMAGVLAGIMHAPLTSIFLVAEITGGYNLFVPLIVTASISYVTAKYFQRNSIYTQRLVEKGEALSHNKDKNILAMLNIDDVMDCDIPTLKCEDTLRLVVDYFKQNISNDFAVVGPRGELLGMVSLNDIRDKIFDLGNLEDYLVSDYYAPSPAIIRDTDTFETITRLFDATKAWNLPVVRDGVYRGMVSQTKLYGRYREVMMHNSSE